MVDRKLAKEMKCPLTAVPQKPNMAMVKGILLGEVVVGLTVLGRKTGWKNTFEGERKASVQFEYNEKRIDLRPDGLLFMEHETEGREIPLFIEMDILEETKTLNLDHFLGKAVQYNSYFVSMAWTDRFEQFPHVAVVVCGVASSAAKRQSKADARIQRIVAKVKGEGKWTQGYNWLFARLDQAQLGHFSMLTAKSAKLVEFNLFGAG